MPLTSGQINFAIGFIIVFALGMAWAYRKDFRKQKKYFKGSLFVLAGIIIALFAFKLVYRLFS